MSRLYLVVVAVSAAILYGSTYQQFRFFTLAVPGGATDAVGYVAMARGEKPAHPEIRHYRWLTPAAARMLEPIARRFVDGDDLSIRLAFYMVNFVFSLVAAIALFRILEVMGYAVPLSLLGVSLFAASRVTVLVTATPMVDAAYFCAIALVLCLTLERRALALAIVLPLLALTKETAVPFLLLPLLTDLRKSPTIWAGLAVAAVAFVLSAQVLQRAYLGGDASYVAIVFELARDAGPRLARLVTAAGLRDLMSGFSLLLAISVIGAWLNARHHYYRIPAVVVATVPIAIVLMSTGNFGRMLFAAYPAVIAYALIAVEHVARVHGTPRDSMPQET